MPCGCLLLAYIGLSTVSDGSPRTIQFQIDDWQNRSWGLHDIDRRRIRCEVAVASDGSRMNRCEHEFLRHYFLREESGTMHTLYLRSENAGYFIDEETRTAYGGPCTCTWEPLKRLADDGECRNAAAARLPKGKRIGTGEVAGYPVVRYAAFDDEGSDTELSLAPGLTCQVMEEIQRWPGTLGIPGAKRRYYVTSYKPGEPDGHIFRLPTGYTIEKHPGHK